MLEGEFYAAEDALCKATRAARCFNLSERFEVELSMAGQIVAEVRHFAATWADTQRSVASGKLNYVKGEDIEKQLIDRLVAFCTPEENQTPP